MFTAKALTVGDLLPVWQITVTAVKPLPAKIAGVQLMSVKGTNWYTGLERQYSIPANRELEVWE